VPFLHWGTEETLKWRDSKLGELAKLREKTPTGELDPPYGKDDSDMYRFYTNMITKQLFPIGGYPVQKPLHLRRTLDQFYYSHGDNTRDRDYDQVVAKYGPLPKPHRVIVTVDQLWLWIIGKSESPPHRTGSPPRFSGSVS